MPTTMPTPLPATTVVPAPTPPPGTAAIPEPFPVRPAQDPIPRGALAAALPGVRRTAHFTVHYKPGTFSESALDVFERDAESAVAWIEEQLQVRWKGRADYYLAYAMFPPPASGVRGQTRYRSHAIFQLYDGMSTANERRYVTTHEITHQVIADTVGDAYSAMASEGLAVWTGESYRVTDGTVSIDGFSRAALETGKMIPITELSDGGAFQGHLFYRYPYDEAGSFVGFLIKTYGVPKFKRVYKSGEYLDVYGKPLTALEAEWKQYLRSYGAVGPFAPDGLRYLEHLEKVQAGFSRLFTVLPTRPVPLRCYELIVAARTAADRADFPAVTRALTEFDALLPPPILLTPTPAPTGTG